MLDPATFGAQAVDPETAKFNEAVERVLAKQPPVTALSPARVRAEREEGKSVWGPIRTVEAAEMRTIRGPAGEIGLRVLIPPAGEVRGVYLHLHGGGWALGAPHHTDVGNWALARHCGVAVLSADYRLAPEHPYPAGPDDCEAAALWLVENAKAEFGSERLLIGGESAGAHLALVTLLRLRDRHGLGGFAAANLAYGIYDLAKTPSVRRWGERNLILSLPIIEWFLDFFVPDETQRAHTDVSPLHADLGGLPPAHMTVGTLDPLLDDTLFLHARWLAAGNQASLFVGPGGIHGFDAFPTPLARRARAEMERFVTRALEAA
jgi:acetyl esterase/lipase